MMQMDRCPILKCDFFEHKEKRRMIRFIRKKSRKKTMMDKLDEILAKLDRL